MTILCELIVIGCLLPAEEFILEPLVGTIGIDLVLLLPGIVDCNVFFDELVVAELSGLGSIREGDLDTSEKGIVLVALELLSQDSLVHLLAVILLHVQVLHCSAQLGVSHFTDPWLTILVGGTWLGHFDVHAVEPKDQLHVGGQGDLDGI